MKVDARIAFFGTPSFTTFALEELSEGGITPDVVVTQPDRPAGRGLLLQESPVKKWAKAHAVAVKTPEKIDEAFIGELSGYDLFIVAGYGKILPKELLDIPAHGTLNIHPSLLPLYRGPSPIEQQILDDAKTVGVSVILLDEETDHGPVLAQQSFTPQWPASRSELEHLLWHEGGTLLANSLPDYLAGTLKPKPQDHARATWTPKLSKEDGLLDLSSDGYKNYLKYLAYERWPGTYFFAEHGGKKIRVKIAEARYENGVFSPNRIIPEGKKEMSYADFSRS